MICDGQPDVWTDTQNLSQTNMWTTNHLRIKISRDIEWVDIKYIYVRFDIWVWPWNGVSIWLNICGEIFKKHSEIQELWSEGDLWQRDRWTDRLDKLRHATPICNYVEDINTEYITETITMKQKVQSD